MFSNIVSWFAKPNLDSSFNHHINADISVVPIGNSASISKQVKRAGQILAREGFKEVRTHGFGTNVSGSWKNLIHASEKIADELLQEKDLNRFSINFKVSFRKDKPGQSIGARLAA